MLAVVLTLVLASSLPRHADAAACGAPPLPANAVASIASGNTGDVAVLGCAAGFTASFEESIACKADGTWEKYCMHCEPTTCKSAPAVPLNAVSSKQDGMAGDLAVLTCASGFEAPYTETLACMADGTWEKYCMYCEVSTTTAAPSTTQDPQDSPSGDWM